MGLILVAPALNESLPAKTCHAALDPSQPACPYPLCAEVQDGIEHFKNHFATMHGVNL